MSSELASGVAMSGAEKQTRLRKVDTEVIKNVHQSPVPTAHASTTV